MGRRILSAGRCRGFALGLAILGQACGPRSAPAWQNEGERTTANMCVPRQRATAHVFPDGTVLVLGGQQGLTRADENHVGGARVLTHSISTYERWDPVREVWLCGLQAGEPRSDHASVAMLDDTALVIGGASFDTPSHTVLIAPTVGDGGFLLRPRLMAARIAPAAVSLGSRVILVLGGGRPGAPLASTERIDLDRGVIEPGPPMHVARYAPVANRLDGRRVLVTGGRGDGGRALADAELFESTSTAEAFQEVAPMPAPRHAHQAVWSADAGQVYVVGGADVEDRATATLWAWDAASDTWHELAPMPTPRVGHTVHLVGGRLVVIGGATDEGPGEPYEPLDTIDVYDPATNQWATVARLEQARRHHVSVVLPDGRVMIAGGADEDGVELDSVELVTLP